MKWWTVKLESSAGFIIVHDKRNENVDHWAPKSRQLVLKQGKGAEEKHNHEVSVMNLKDDHDTWKFVL